jgi:membrane-associated phospholipid phosphatase
MSTSSATPRRRRPSGEAPPLPATPEARWWLWFGVVVMIAGLLVKLLLRETDLLTGVGNDMLRWFADHRSGWIVDIAKALNALTLVAVVFALRLAIVGVLAVYKLWRHLVVALVAFVLSDFIVDVVLDVARPTPTVASLVSDPSYHFPSRAVASLGITLFGAGAAGRPGRRPPGGSVDGSPP